VDVKPHLLPVLSQEIDVFLPGIGKLERPHVMLSVPAIPYEDVDN